MWSMKLMIHDSSGLYEQKDWEAKAIEHYEKFLALWKDADLRKEAEKRLVSLKKNLE